MDVLTSSEFRKAYAKLTRPTTVTVNGHPIGQWLPTGAKALVVPADAPDEDAPPVQVPRRQLGRFGASRPAPKPGRK